MSFPKHRRRHDLFAIADVLVNTVCGITDENATDRCMQSLRCRVCSLSQRQREDSTVRLMTMTTVDTATNRKDLSSGCVARHTNTTHQVRQVYPGQYRCLAKGTDFTKYKFLISFPCRA